MKTRKGLPVLLAGVLTAGVFALPSNAKSAQAGAAPMYADGIAASEIVLLNDTTQVEVEKEKLTFHAEKLPEPYAGVKCEGTLRAEYTLYNPSAEDETLRLALPLGSTNNYYYDYDGDGAHGEYTVTMNGEPVETKLRHSYLFEYETPTAENLTGAPEMLKADTPVYEYSFTATKPTEYDDKDMVLCAEVYYDRQSTLLLGSDIRNAYPKNGNEIITFWLGDSAKSYSFYLAGEAGTLLSVYLASTDGEVELTNAEVSFVGGVSTFADYAGEPPYKEVSVEDWQRIIAVWAVDRQYDDRPLYELLYRFSEYEITVPAGGRVTHAVQTPLIPSVQSAKCLYSYDFGAARSWADFHSLEVEIYAESAPSESSLNLVAGEGVYTHERSTLPMNALRFSLGEYEETKWRGGGLSDLEIALILFAVLLVLAGGVVLIVVKVRRKRVKALQKRMEQEADKTANKRKENGKKGE